MVEPSSRPDNIEPFLSEEVPTLSSRTGPGRFYLPSGQLQLLEQLEHLSRYSHFIQIVTGVSGSGKSTLLEQFFQLADDSAVHSCLINLQQQTSSTELLDLIVQQLKLDAANDPQQQLQALVQHCQLLQQLSKQLLIVIDDAEQLQPDALKLLFNQLSTLKDEEQRPHLVLFATPTLRKQLADPELSAVVESSCHFFELQPLDQQELNALLEHSYSAVAARLNDDSRAQLLSDSLGLPGRIPRVIEAIMGGTAPSPAEPKNDAIPQSKSPVQPARWPWIIAVLAGLMMVAGWLLWPQLQQLNQFDPDAERIRVEIPVTPKPINGEPSVAEPPAAQGSDFEQRLAQARAALEAEQQQLNQPEPEQTVASSAQPPANQQLDVAPIKPVTEPTEAAETSNATIDPKSEHASKPQPGDQTAKASEINAEKASSTLVLNLPQPSEQLSAPITDSTTTDKPAQLLTDTKNYYGDGKQLLALKSEGYTLQMLGARQEKSVGGFVASMPNQDQLKRFYTLYKKKPWYVVIYGRYPNRAAAMAAIGELPPQLRARRPWARSIAGVQDDIRKGGN